MKFSILGCVLCAVVACVAGLEWDVTENGQKCIMVHWNVTSMILEAKPKSDEPAEKQSLEADTGTVDTSSSCGNTTGNLNVKISDGTLSLTFMTDAGNIAQMDGTFIFKPNDFFQNGETEEMTLSFDGQLPLSHIDMSYKCVSEASYKFSEGTSTGNYTYSLLLGVSGVQIQAFNVNNNDFSQATECSLDSLTSEAPSTESPTTEPRNEISTESPAVVTTQPETSVAPTGPAVPKYVFINNTVACVIIQGMFKLTVNYTTKNGDSTVKVIAVPSSATVSGMCPNADETASELTLTWGSSGATRTMTFKFTATKTEAKLSEIHVAVELDNATFPDANKTSVTVQFPVTDVTLFEPTGYMTCKTLQTMNLGEGLELASSDLSIQAFHVNGSDFTGKEQVCEADQTTVAPPTTVSPTQSPSGTPHVNTYVVGDEKCIVFSAGLQFDITYYTATETKTVSVSIPENFTSDGECGNVTQSLSILFNTDWIVTLIFTNGASSTYVDSGKYGLQNISMTYHLTNDLFPGSNETGQKSFMAQLSSDVFQSKMGGAYQCNKQQTVDLGHGVKMETFDLKYKAFSTNNSTKLDEDLTECPSDSSTNSIVPIAVGAALAALVIIVLIAYLIGRKRSRTGYEQV